MKTFIIILAIILAAVVFVILFDIFIVMRRFKKEAEQSYKAYAEEAKTLDDMAGLLEGLFDVENPRRRRKCAHCTHIRQCVYTGKLPDNDTVCECFDRRTK